MGADSERRVSWLRPRPEIRPPMSFLLAAAAVGLVLRLAFGLGYWVGQPLTQDEREYLSLARSLTAGHGFVYDDEVASGAARPFSRAPGYPAFVALVGGGAAVTGTVPASLKIGQASVGALGVLAVGFLACRLGGVRAAKFAAVLAAGYPPLVWIAGYALSEAAFWPLGLAAAWWFDLALGPNRRRAARAAFVCGALAGLATLMRPAMVVFVGAAALWLLWQRHPRRTAVLLAGALLLVGPWTARNYARDGRLILVAAEGGVTFWTGNHPLARGDGDLASNPDLKRAKLALRARYPDFTEAQMESVYYREAFAWIRAHPFRWLALEGRKLFYLVVPVGPSYTSHSARYYAASVLSYGVALPLALAGTWRLGARRRRTPGLWLLVGAALAGCLLFFPQERFRIPIIDPALIVCAGGVWTAGREVTPEG
jgi:4-amino-4-deoxy-L-arabinose transferase-like glycosyltransferase